MQIVALCNTSGIAHAFPSVFIPPECVQGSACERRHYRAALIQLTKVPIAQDLL